jgi:hypothetical protein
VRGKLMSQQFSKKPMFLLQISRQINELNNSISHFPTFPGTFSPNIEKFRQITGGLKIGDRAQIQGEESQSVFKNR